MKHLLKTTLITTAIIFLPFSVAAEEPAKTTNSALKSISIDLLGRMVVASRNCGDGTSIKPLLMSAYISRFATQENISFEKAKYMAIAKGDETLLELITTGKKDEFCLKVIK